MYLKNNSDAPKADVVFFFYIIFVEIHSWIGILWRFEFFEKCLTGLAVANFKRPS